ncbi:MAG TPA: vanadium-dependent haloperoxidase [Gammaproteobacteria bacterium]
MNVLNKRVVGAVLLSCVAATAFSGAAWADVVTDWNATAQAVLVAKNHQGPPGYAFVHVAMYDAVNAIDGRYSVFAARPASSVPWASQEAAAATAAYQVLKSAYEDQDAAVLAPAYAASLAAIPDGPAKTKGIEIGEDVAAAWLALRAGDGREAVVPYLFQPAAPGVYQRTPPAFPNALAPWLAVMRPFAMTRPSQFRAPGPPDLTSDLYAKDVAFTQALGAANSTERTAEETEIARFYTESPTTFFSHNLRDFAAAKNLGVTGNARLFAQVFVTAADSMIACWDSKYYYNFWRPVTAITTDLDDGNPATARDPAWTPLAVTPPHPEYPAGHGCVSTGYAEALKHFFGKPHLAVTLTSSVPGTVPHVFDNTNKMIDEIILARVAGGMHFQTSIEDGATIGKKVGQWVARNHFRPVGTRR